VGYGNLYYILLNYGLMANQTTQSFGIFSGSGGGGGGSGTVTSVAAGTGITCTPDPITATGTVSQGSVNGLVSTFDGNNNAVQSLAGSGTINMYDPTTYPATTFTMVQQGRVAFGLQNVSVNERIGIGGLGTFDEITFTASVSTDCASGLFAVTGTGNGVMGQTYAVSPAAITCDGSVQTQTITTSTFRVGNNGVSSTNAGTDFFQTTYIYSGSGGNVRYSDITITVTQFSD
jgi:hypothetical protein